MTSVERVCEIPVKQVKKYSFAEELIHSISHGIGLVFSIIGLVILLQLSMSHGDVWHVVGYSIFCGSLILLYLSSTLYHSIANVKTKKMLRILDHSAIFITIASTYSFFMLINLRDSTFAWIILAILWSIAISGIIMKLIKIDGSSKLSLFMYISMGWLCIADISSMLLYVPFKVLTFIVLGGIIYTLGVIFYAIKTIPYGHAIWHMFVLAGSSLHYTAAIYNVLPT